MSYILVGTYFGLSFIFRKNKKVAYILLTILVILSIFSGENADSNIYKARYNSADYFADLYRLQAGLLTLDYITLSYYYQKNNKVGDNILFKITSMVLPVFILYFYVLNNESALYVIDPLIKNSLLN